MNSLRIPRTVHRVWLGGKPMPERFEAYGQSWLDRNPGWTLRTWTEADLADLTNRKAFEAAPTYSEKSDFARYEILLRHGGVYVDTDFECLQPIESILQGTDGFVAREDRCLGTAVIGAVPGHPFISAVVDRISDSFWRNVTSTNASLKVGPIFLQGVYDEIGRGLSDSVLRVFDPSYFFPYHYTEKHRRDESFAGAYGVHHWAHSWDPRRAEGTSPEISVVVYAEEGVRSARTALESLAEQSLDPDRYEVVLVVPDRAIAVGAATEIESVVVTHPRARIRHLATDRLGFSVASLTVDDLDGAYVTFVRAGDRVGPRFLEEMLRRAAPERMVVVPSAGRNVGEAISSAWGKLVPVTVAREACRLPELSYGMNEAFWLTALSVGGLKAVAGAKGADADYRTETESRGEAAGAEPSFEERLAAIQVWDRLPLADSVTSLRDKLVSSEIGSLKTTGHRVEHSLIEALAQLDLRSVAWREALAGHPQRELVLVAARDIASCAHLTSRGVGLDVCTYAADQVGLDALGSSNAHTRHVPLTGPPVTDWSLFDAYARALMVDCLPQLLTADHRVVRSVGSDPAEHLAAALVKIGNPELRWEAAPLPWKSTFPVQTGAVFEMLTAGLVEAGFEGEEVPEDACELAMLAVEQLADAAQVERTPAEAPVAPPEISVILPTYQGDDWIVGCLDALAAQTLDRTEFEVVVVANGPRTRTPEIVEEWLAAHPGLRLQLIVTEKAGLCHARNVGLDAATGAYATFVDDDDLVAPRMLEVLLAKARPGVIPMAAVGLFSHDPADAEFENWYTQPLLPHLVTGADNVRLYPTLAAPWAKLVSTDLARRVRFREELRKNEERVFWMDILAAERLQVVFAEWRADAAYLYRQRDDSLMGRADKSWDGFALPWFDAASALREIDPPRRETADLIYVAHGYMFGNFLRTYVAAHPQDAGRCARTLAERGLSGPEVPWRQMFAKSAREVVFLGTAPAHDGAGQSFAQRVASAATHAVDVVAYEAAAPGAGLLEDRAGAAGVPLDSVVGAPGAVRLTWSDFGALATRVGAELEKLEATKPGAYLAARSVSAAPVDHLLAALFKLARPGAVWTAEIAQGARREPVLGVGTTIEGDRWFQVLGAGLVEAGYPVDEVPERLERFAEMVTLGLADRIVFDSVEQADEVLGQCPVPEIADRARSVMTLADEREQVVA